MGLVVQDNSTAVLNRNAVTLSNQNDTHPGRLGSIVKTFNAIKEGCELLDLIDSSTIDGSAKLLMKTLTMDALAKIVPFRHVEQTTTGQTGRKRPRDE